MVGAFSFSRLPEIHFGTGSSEKAISLAGRFGERILLVTGKSSFTDSKWGKRLLYDLDATKIKYDIISVSGEPVTTFIDTSASAFREQPPDVIVAVGGGSVIDAGKALSAIIPVTGKTSDYLEGNPVRTAHPGTRLPLIALPTTAGTGSEVTKNAVLSIPAGPALKSSLRHDSFAPDIAVVDPGLAAGCPPGITAASGLDALTQLLEAFTSTNASEMTDALALSGLERGFGSIRQAVEDGGNLSARSDMAYAAMLSGIVLANAGLGAVHGFASVLGGHYKIPHGVICGTLLGAVTRANISKLKGSDGSSIFLEKYSQAGRLICRKENKSDDYYVMSLADELEKLIMELDIPRLGQFGIARDDAGKLAMETGIKNNPVQLDKDELKAILVSRL
jgi:alcohol dehydrogenase class IV